MPLPTIFQLYPGDQCCWLRKPLINYRRCFGRQCLKIESLGCKNHLHVRIYTVCIQLYTLSTEGNVLPII
jgi:hypothetical protein